MIIDLYTCCFNEADILPFVIDYWKNTVDHVTVYDNYSTDNSISILKKHDWIDVIEYDSNNLLNDYMLLEIKNNAWKKSKGNADFTIVCDLDECVYSYDLKHILEIFKAYNVIGITPMMYNLISKDFPKYKHHALMHQLVDKYYFDKWEDFNECNNLHGIKQKMLIIDPNKITSTGYKIGCYESLPKGNGKFITTDDIKCYHLHDVGLFRKIKRYHDRARRMSKEHILDHLSDFYCEKPTNIISDFMNDLKNAKTLCQY